jgi:hypothetical protein
MLTYLRYALTIVCFAASVGCLLLWCRSITTYDSVAGPILCGDKAFLLVSHGGSAWLSILYPASHETVAWEHITFEFPKPGEAYYVETKGGFQLFSSDKYMALYFPIWYPALIFALAGVAAQRLGRRFTLRSAIIATTVVAGLLGMAVAVAL